MQSSAVPLSVVTCNRQPTPFQPIPNKISDTSGGQAASDRLQRSKQFAPLSYQTVHYYQQLLALATVYASGILGC